MKTGKRFKNSRRYHKVRLMYQDEAGFDLISKIGKAWAPKGLRPHVHSHYIREYRYCYGAVDAMPIQESPSSLSLGAAIRIG